MPSEVLAPTIFNLTLTNANQEYSQALPANTKRYSIQARTAADVRASWAIGKVANSYSPFWTIKSGSALVPPEQAAVPDGNNTVYLATGTAGTIVEITAWSPPTTDISFNPFNQPGFCSFFDTRSGYVFSDSARTLAAVNGGNAGGMTDRGVATKHWQFQTTAPAWNSGGWFDYPTGSAAYGLAGANTDWKFMHDGTGCTIYLPFNVPDEQISVFFNTGSASLADTGMIFWLDDVGATEGQVIWRIHNASGAFMSDIATNSAGNVVPAGLNHLATLKYKVGATGGEVQMKINGCPLIKKATVTSPATGNSTYGLQSGAPVSTLPPRGRVYPSMFFNQFHSSAVDKSMAEWFNTNILAPMGATVSTKRIAWLGDSITGGIGISGVVHSFPDLSAIRKGRKYYTDGTTSNFVDEGADYHVNYGVSGSYINVNGGATNVQGGQWTSKIQLNSTTMRRQHNKYVILVGINDILSTVRTAVQMLSDLDSLIAEILAWDGNEIVLCTLTPAGGAITAPQKLRYADYNTGIRTRASSTIVVVDLANHPILNDGAGNLASTANSGDNLHPNQYGMQLISDAISPYV